MASSKISGFCGLDYSVIEELNDGDIALLGAQNATPYEPGKPSHSEDAPDAIRDISRKFANWLDHHDFDTDCNLVPFDPTRLRDLGNLDTDPSTPASNRERIASAVREVLLANATPIVLGGDDSVPIPMFNAFSNSGPIWIVQIDAHIDWRQERFGEPMGWSSTMRRASELPGVEGIVQIGARGVGSATRSDLEDAIQWGAKIVTARQVFERGIKQPLNVVPDGSRVVIALDCDAFDPSIMPGVMASTPGGLNYWHMIEILEVLSAKSLIVGCSIVELAPQRDVGNLTTLTASRIVSCMIAAIHKSQTNT